MFVILAGEATKILAGCPVALRVGDSLAIPAGTLHQFRNDGHAPVRFLVISAPRQGWDRIDEPEQEKAVP